MPPYGLVMSPVLRHQAGDPLSRRVSSPTNAGTFLIAVERSGSYRETNVTIFDTRVEKQFRFARGAHVGAFVDLFNLNNGHAAQSQDNQTGRRTVTLPDGS